MTAPSPRALTWLTLVAALCSAVLLAGEDAGLPDLKNVEAMGLGAASGPTLRHAAAPLPHRTRDVDARRRER